MGSASVLQVPRIHNLYVLITLFYDERYDVIKG